MTASGAELVERMNCSVLDAGGEDDRAVQSPLPQIRRWWAEIAALGRWPSA
jgi:hypothetical protein